MPINLSDKINLIGFSFGSEPDLNALDLFVFSIGRLNYDFIESGNDFRLVNGNHLPNKYWIDVEFEVNLGYHWQQANLNKQISLNTGIATLNIPAKPYLDWIDISNKLMKSSVYSDTSDKVWFFPLLENGFGIAYFDYYLVSGIQDRTTFLESSLAGFVRPDLPLRMKVSSPLNQYPSWASRRTDIISAILPSQNQL